MAEYFSGLDLGQARDYSALVVLEQNVIPDPEQAGGTVNRFDVRHIHRWQLGTSYPAVIADLREWYGVAPLNNSTLVVDGTGVGRPVVDMIRESQLTAIVEAFSITAGSLPGVGTVPKKDLVGSVQAALQTRRVRFAEDLELRPVLERELETFRVKVTADRNETFSSWREKDHDDLVLAVVRRAVQRWWCMVSAADRADVAGVDGRPGGECHGVEVAPARRQPGRFIDGGRGDEPSRAHHPTAAGH